MKTRYVFSSCAAVILSISMAAAQSTSDGARPQSPQTPSSGTTQGEGTTRGGTQPGTQTGTQPPTGTQTQTGTQANQMTLTGCITREGAAASEFVLNTAMGATGATGQRPGNIGGSTSSGRDASAVGTSGAATRYMLSGTRAGDLSRYVGQRVEVVATRETGTGVGVTTTPRSGSAGTSTTPGTGATSSGSTASGSTASGNTASGNTATGNTRDRQDTAIATDPAAGGQSDSTRAQAGGAQRTTAPVQRVTVVSVRPIGGDCQ